MSTLSQALPLNSTKPLRRAIIWLLPVLSFTAATALAAHIKIYLPFTPVPVTFQSLVVVLAGAFLGSKRGLLSQVLLIAVGMIGLPVFTSTQHGLDVIFGATGGYILGFLLCAYVSGLISERGALKGIASSYAWLFAASLFIFVPGVIWLKLLMNVSWLKALELGFFPFILGDLIKTALASGALATFRRHGR